MRRPPRPRARAGFGRRRGLTATRARRPTPGAGPPCNIGDGRPRRSRVGAPGRARHGKWLRPSHRPFRPRSRTSSSALEDFIARLGRGRRLTRLDVHRADRLREDDRLARQWGERQDCPVVLVPHEPRLRRCRAPAVQFRRALRGGSPPSYRATGTRSRRSRQPIRPEPARPRSRPHVRGDPPGTSFAIVDEWEAAETPRVGRAPLHARGRDPGVRWVITTRDAPEWFTPRLGLRRGPRHRSRRAVGCPTRRRPKCWRRRAPSPGERA